VLSMALTPVPGKCSKYGCNTVITYDAVEKLGIMHQAHGVVVTGTPMCSHKFVTNSSSRRFDKCVPKSTA
jgi:hypothetical protein